MNFKLTISLALILLVSAIIFMLIPQSATGPKTAGGTTPLLATKPADIRSITYLRDGSVNVKFVKEGDTWKMTDPVNAAVESFTVSGIASSLQTIAYRRKFEPEATGDKSPESTGTAKPHNIVKFTDDAGKEYTLAFGKHSNDGVFTTLNSDKTIYVVDGDPIEQLDKKPDDFRNKQIKQLDTTKIARLNIKTPDSDVTLAKSADGTWLISAPISSRANQTTVEDIVKEFGNIQAASFSTLDKQIAGTATPDVSVTAWLQQSPPSAPSATAPAATAASQPALTPVTLQFGYFTDALRREDSNVYASLADNAEVFVYNKDAYKKLNKQLKDLRDPAVALAAVANATDFTLTTDGAATVSASKKENQWSLANTPSRLSGDSGQITTYLNTLRDLRAINYVDNAGNLKAIGLDPPHMKIDLAVPGQSAHEVLLVGKPETSESADKVTPVMRQGEATVYLLPTAEAQKIATSTLDLRDRDVDSLNADRIRTIAITGALATAGVPPATAPATGPAAAPAHGLTLAREGSRWSVKADGSTSTAADDSKISALLSEFTPLKATKYLDAKTETATAGITVTLTLVEPTLNTPATAPATLPSTALAGAATTSAPATRPTLSDVLPATGIIAPDPGKTVTRTLRLFHHEDKGVTTWTALWDNQSPAWTFEPSPALVDHLTKETYTQPTTQPAPKSPVP